MSERMPQGRGLPHSDEAEFSVLGGAMLDGGVMPDLRALLATGHFHAERHRIIWDALVHLSTSGGTTDAVSVYDYLKGKPPAEGLEAIGGPGYLAELEENVPSAAYAVPHARIVKAKAAIRRMIVACATLAEEGGDAEDAAAYLEQAEQVVRQVRDEHATARSDGRHLDVVMHDLQATIDERIQSPGTPPGLTTGLADLDRLLCGMQPGGLYLLAARPAMGKTALALNIAQHAAGTGASVLLHSIEMPEGELAERMMACTSRVNARKLRTGNLNSTDIDAIVKARNDMHNLPITIIDDALLTPLQLRARARRMKGLGLVVVDYLQIMRADTGGRFKDRREQEVSYISRTLKATARDLGVPILALSQLNRQVEQRRDRRPMLADLRESGALEQDADAVMFIYRDEVYDPDSSEKGVAELHLAKHRHGPVGHVRLRFFGEHTRFENYREDTWTRTTVKHWTD